MNYENKQMTMNQQRLWIRELSLLAKEISSVALM